MRNLKFLILLLVLSTLSIFAGCKASLVDDLKGYYDESGIWHEAGELAGDEEYDVWYYLIETESSTGNRADIFSCVSSTGEHISPGIVSTPWRSVNYARPRKLPPMEIGVQAYLTGTQRPGIPPEEIGTGRLTAKIILNGELVAAATDSGTIYDCSATPTFMIGTIPTYSMIYDSNGASAGLPPIDDAKYEAGDRVKIARGGYLLEKPGSSFLGWSIQSDGGGRLYRPDDSLDMPDRDLRLYAVWTALPTWMLRYDGNGNTSGSAPDPERYLIGEDCPAISTATGMGKDGFKLAGWNTRADGSGTSTAIYASLSRQFPETVLYALWLDENLRSEGMGTTIRITGFELPPTGVLRIPQGITEIGSLSPASLGPFKDCIGITGLVLPDTLTAIGARAFQNCDNLAALSLPNSVEAIGAWAFKDCSSLVSIDFGENIETIGGEAFMECASLESLVIPSSVVSLGSSAFSSCETLDSVVFERVVEDVGSGLFANCDRLGSVALPEGLVEIPHSMFYHCDGLTSIDIPSSVSRIGQLAFAYCSRLGEIELPGSLTQMGKYAFEYCSNLGNITIPASVRDISEGLFYESGLNQVLLAEGIETIGEASFFGCDYLSSVALPSSIFKLGGSAFTRCGALSEVFFKSALPPEHSLNPSFLHCASNLEIHVPAGCLGAYATAPNWAYFVSKGTYTLVSP